MTRVDALLAEITADAEGEDWKQNPDWSELDRVIELARELEAELTALKHMTFE